MDLVDVERKLARKAGNNARGAVGRDVISVLHYSKAHYESMPLPQLRKDSVF